MAVWVSLNLPIREKEKDPSAERRSLVVEELMRANPEIDKDEAEKIYDEFKPQPGRQKA